MGANLAYLPGSAGPAGQAGLEPGFSGWRFCQTYKGDGVVPGWITGVGCDSVRRAYSILCCLSDNRLLYGHHVKDFILAEFGTVSGNLASME